LVYLQRSFSFIGPLLRSVWPRHIWWGDNQLEPPRSFIF